MSIYGSGISRLNYQAETATLNNLLRDWETLPELADVVATFNLTGWMNELKTANDAFNALYLSRTFEYGDANPETIKTKREETNVAYYALRDRIAALHLLVEDEPSPYITVINRLNALTDQYNQLLISRSGTITPESPGTPEV